MSFSSQPVSLCIVYLLLAMAMSRHCNYRLPLFKLITLFDQHTNIFVWIDINIALTSLQSYPSWQSYAILHVWWREMCRYVLYLHCLYLMRFLHSLLATVGLGERHVVNAIFKYPGDSVTDRSLASKNSFVPVSKLKVYGMFVYKVCWGEADLVTHVGLTLPSWAKAASQTHVHYFMCIAEVGTLYVWDWCAACPRMVTASLSWTLLLR